MTFQQVQNAGGETDVCAAHEAEKKSKELWDEKDPRTPTFVHRGREISRGECDQNEHRRHRAPRHGGRLRAHDFFREAKPEFY